MAKARVSSMTVYDCKRIKIVRDTDGRSVYVEFGDNGIGAKLEITAFRWDGEDPMEIEIHDAREVEDAEANLNRRREVNTGDG